MKDEELLKRMGDTLKEMRRKAGFKSVSDLCERLGDVKCKRYYMYEQGKSPMPLDLAIRVADIFDCSLDELLGRNLEATGTSLARDETELLAYYQRCDILNRQTILVVARNAALAVEKNAGNFPAPRKEEQALESFGKTLKQILDAKGMKCVELAKLTGLSEPYLSRLVNGKQKDPTFAKGCAICTALDMTVDEFLKVQA